jgi:hypothetical protein
MLRVKSARVSFMLGLLQDSGNHCTSIVNSFNAILAQIMDASRIKSTKALRTGQYKS